MRGKRVKVKEAKEKKKFPLSKVLMIFLFCNCTIVEIFTMYVTIQSFRLAYATSISPDFSPLNTLVGTIVAEVIGFAVYSLKSMKENSAGGIIFETAMRENAGSESAMG